MDGLKELCKCCKLEGCEKPKIVTRKKGSCKIIKCLQFIKDEEKIKLINSIEEGFNYDI